MKVPSILAVAFNCALPNAVPAGIAIGVAQVIVVGVAKTLAAALDEDPHHTAMITSATPHIDLRILAPHTLADSNIAAA
jgi:photosystem II stability/assembly factor-like uncharacterized protein